MSVVVDIAELKEKRNEEGYVQTQTYNGPAESNSDVNGCTPYIEGPDLGVTNPNHAQLPIAEPVVTANYNENLLNTEKSSSLTCDNMNNGNNVNMMINFHMELIREALKILTQCIER